ncbi:uncharacterized protein Dbp73D [Panulirus ornatus]|uniref:uncharacterized protein Dbp73D n=1 Tax=Panulirus ornatus TaxID=150431 RepID=UPI003A8BBAF9
MAQNTTVIPRRYWGPGSTGDVGSSSGSPSQASVLLARINERARARKTVMTPLVNGPYSEAQREHTTNDEQSSEETRKLTQVTAFEEQLSNESKIDEKHKECINKQNTTSKGEMVASVKEVLNDEYRIKKKRDSTFENRANTLDDDELIPCDMEDETPKRKKKISTEKKSTSREEVLVNGIDSPSDTVEMANDTQYKKKKKELKDQHRKNSMEEMNCVSDTLTDDSCFKSPKKKTKKKRKSNTIDEDSLGKICNDVKEPDVQEDENFDELTKKKKKKCENEEKFTMAEGTISSLENESGDRDFLLAGTKKKKRRKDKQELLDEEINIQIGESNDCGSTFSMPETKQKKKKRKDIQELPNEEINVQIGERNDCSSTFSMPETKQKKRKRKDIQELPNEEINVQIGESNDCSSTFSMPETKQKKKKRKNIQELPNEEINVQIGEINESMPETKQKKRKRKNKQELPNEVDNVQISEINKCGSTVVESEKAMSIEERDEKTPPEKDHEVVDTKKSIDSEVIKSKLDTSVKEKDTTSKKKRKKKEKKTKVQDEEIKDFTLMREFKSAHKIKLQRTLPHWLANPTIISRDLHSDGAPIDSIQGLDASLKNILEKRNIRHFFPVQKAVIPEILSSISSLSTRYRPRDICISVPTGSGKTLAYVLPIIQALKGRTVPRIRALVLLPVQELALQVYKVFKTYLRGSYLKVGIAVGQATFQKEQASLVIQDYAGYRPAIDILVATPGRLDDHLKFTKGIDLSSLRYLVLDEADQMLAAEGGEWVTSIEQAVKCHEASSENALINGFQGSGPTQLPHIPVHRLLFSATLSHDPEQLQQISLYRPKLFTITDTSSANDGVKKPAAGTVVGQYTRPAELKEEYVIVDESVKPLILHHLITTKSWRRVLVFTNSCETTHKLAVLMAAMSDSLTVAEFSSSQKSKRRQIVSHFSSGKIDILVSTDAMARGLDIRGIEHVVSYDITSVNTYVHRIGRTARAGRPGTALSLVTKDMMKDVRALLSSGAETVTELIVSTEELEPYESLYISALAKMKEIILQEQQERRVGRNRGSTTHSVRKFKRLKYSKRPHKKSLYHVEKK